MLSPLLAFGFGNIAILGWLAAAAAPLLIHLWSRHRFREAPWAAMQFLLAALRKNSRRMQLQQWLLLAIRTLIILLVVLAVAEPYGERFLADGATAPTHRIIVLDASYSMAYRTSGTSAFTRAKQLAARLVRESRMGDAFTVIRMAAQAEEVVGPDVIDHATVAAKIESLAMSQSGADLQAALALVQSALENAKDLSQNRRGLAHFAESAEQKVPVPLSADDFGIGPRKAARVPEQKEVVVLSDLQRATWESVESRPNRPAEVSKLLQSIAQRSTIAVIDLGQPQAANLAITRFEATDPLITPNRAVAFDVLLHQFGTTPRPKCLAEFSVDGAPFAEQTVDLPAGGDATLRFNHRFSSAGSHSLAVRAAGDAIELDNTRWLSVRVVPELRVLCVAGRPNAAKYVADALNPNSNVDSAIQPHVMDESEFADASLADYAGVVLCNVARLTANETARLSQFAEAGGGIIVLLGDRVDAASYNSFAVSTNRTETNLKANDSPAGGSLALDPSHPMLIPARLGQVVVNQQFGLDPLDYRHPIVAPFRGRERAGLLTTPVTRYYRLELPRNHAEITAAAALPNGDPFIVTAPFGNGRVVLVATDASLSSVDSQSGEPWTIWPTWPSFLPIVREMLSFVVGSQHARWQQQVGTPLAGRVPGSTTSSQLQIRRPDGRLAASALHDTPSGREWSYADTDTTGIYAVQGLSADQSQQFAVNLDTEESDLVKADASRFPREVKVQDNWQIGPARQTTDLLTQSSWNRPLLWSTLGLLFMEAFLAWLFGRGAI